MIKQGFEIKMRPKSSLVPYPPLICRLCCENLGFSITLSACSPSSSPSFCVAYMRFHQCYINTVTQTSQPGWWGYYPGFSGDPVHADQMPRGEIYVSLLLDEGYEAEILRHKWIIKSVGHYPAVPGAASVHKEGEWRKRWEGMLEEDRQKGRCREEGDCFA